LSTRLYGVTSQKTVMTFLNHLHSIRQSVGYVCLFIINPRVVSVLLATQTLFAQEKQAISGAVSDLEPQLQPTTTDGTVGTSHTEVSVHWHGCNL
jgi:hypothetical protein